MIKPWATYSWYLFHTIAQRINPVYFKHNRKMCLGVIFSICDILPCPVCRDHAVKYLYTNKFFNITTKQELIMFFFNFHNQVNSRLGKNLAVVKDLNRYNYTNKNKLFHGFVNHMTARYYNIAYFTQSRRRNKINKIKPFLLDIFRNMEKV